MSFFCVVVDICLVALQRPPYNSDLSSCDFHGFGPLNKSPKGRRFNFNVEFAVRNGCANSSKDFTGRKFVEQKKLYSFYAYLILKK